jgi:hypothetical protein
MSSLIRTPHQNTAGSLFIVTEGGYLLAGTHNGEGFDNTGSELAAETILMDLGHIIALNIGTSTDPDVVILRKVALITDPLTSGYIHLPTFNEPAIAGPSVAKFQL